jgi:hypothetical protein
VSDTHIIITGSTFLSRILWRNCDGTLCNILGDNTNMGIEYSSRRRDIIQGFVYNDPIFASSDKVRNLPLLSAVIVQELLLK